MSVRKQQLKEEQYYLGNGQEIPNPRTQTNTTQRTTIPKTKEVKIICGFAGIGKSTLARTLENVVDLESTPFEKDWDRYVKVAKHMANNGYLVLLSCHKELREKLHESGIDYVVAMPDKSMKEVYLNRYKNRKNTKDFIEMMDKNWDNFLTVYSWETKIVINGFLEDNYANK